MFIEILSSQRAWSEWVTVESEGLDYVMSSWQPGFQEFQEFCLCLSSVRASQRRTCLRLGRRKWKRSPYLPNARLAGHSHGRGRRSGCSGSALQTLAQLSSSLQPRPPPAAWLRRWGLHRSNRCHSLLQAPSFRVYALNVRYRMSLPALMASTPELQSDALTADARILWFLLQIALTQPCHIFWHQVYFP